MAQYAVMIFENATELPPEVLAAHGALPDRIADAGGKTLGGLALEPPSQPEPPPAPESAPIVPEPEQVEEIEAARVAEHEAPETQLGLF